MPRRRADRETRRRTAFEAGGRRSSHANASDLFHASTIAAELSEHVADRPGGDRIPLDEHDFTGTPGQRLEPERATAREQVQATRAGQFELQPVEHGLTDSVRSRPQTRRWWEMQLATAPFATDDSHFEAAACGGSHAACRGTTRRTVCCSGKTARARSFRAIVAWHRQASVGFVKITNTRDATRGFN